MKKVMIEDEKLVYAQQLGVSINELYSANGIRKRIDGSALDTGQKR